MNFKVLNFDQKKAKVPFATIYVQKGRLEIGYKMRMVRYFFNINIVINQIYSFRFFYSH